jgi:hypothetical protein
LPNQQSKNLTIDEIGYKLIEIWLDRYKKVEAHPYCRIEDYDINGVYYDEHTSSLPIQPRGDFLRVVDFSIKLIQVPNDWMSFSGTLDPSNWLRIIHPIAISQTNNGYIMEFAYP